MPFSLPDSRHLMMMAATWNPLFWWSGAVHAATPPRRPIYADKRPDPRTPIAIDVRASDKGIRMVQVDKDTVRISGKAKGDEPGKDIFGFPIGSYARSVFVGLDIDEAPTTTIFGNTDYTEKNSRGFMVYTNLGQSAHKLAHALAAKVNAEDDFRATVVEHRDGSASITFKRR